MPEEKKTIASLVAELPEIIQDYLYDPDAVESFDKVIDAHNLGFEQERELLQVINRIIVKEVSLKELAPLLQKRLGVDEQSATNIAKDLAGYKFLPLDTYLGDVDGYIRSLGGNPDDYPKKRIQVEERTTDAAVKDVEGVVAVGQLPHRLKTRFENVLRSYFKGVRTDSQLIDILTREEKVGGVGLSMDAAREVVKEAQEEKRSVIIKDQPVGEMPEPEASVATSESEKEVKKAPVPTPVSVPKPKDSFVTVLPEDEEEIEELKKKLPKEELKKSSDTDDKIKKSVDEIYKASGVGLGSSETLQDRFRTIIENRLRDIRDQLETLQILVQPKELGGLSLSQDDARRIITLIEGKLKGVHEKHQEVVKENKATWVADEARKSSERSEAEKTADTASRENAYQQATMRSKKLAHTATPSKPAPPSNLPIPAGNASAPVPATLARPAPKAGAIQTMPTPARVAVSPPPPATKQPPASPVRPVLVAPKPAVKPIMKDVQSSTPTATGPVEALRTTSLVDFRRLSKIPKEATLKIKDKIDLLGQDSFSERSAGIAAWKESGVFKLYLEMMREALEGKSMEEVIAGRLAEKKDVLTKDEMDAIVQLGISLRA